MRTILGLLLFSAAPVAQHTLWSATGDGTVSRAGELAVIGDDDGDGWSDYVQVGWPGTYPFGAQLWVYSGRTGARLRRIHHPWADVVATLRPALDFDRDGLVDLVMGVSSNALQLGAVELRSARDGHAFWEVQYLFSQGTAPFGNDVLADVDVDGDGNPDVVTGQLVYVTGAANGGYYVYDHMGQVRYARLNQSSAESWPWGFANLRDIDGDGGDDFAVVVRTANGVGHADIVSGRTGTTLRRHASPSGSRVFSASGTGDLDGDGVRDVVLCGDRVEAISTVTGALIHSWGAGASSSTWWSQVDSTRDLDRDGVEDVLAVIAPGPAWRFRLVAWSGRDGSLMWDSYPHQVDATHAYHLHTPGGLQRSLLRIAVPPGITGPGRVDLFGWEPAGMTEAARSCQGALSTVPDIGMRTLPNGFRITLANAPAATGALLVLGTSLQPGSLSPFGFPACTLHPSIADSGFLVTGGIGLDRGYARHDFTSALTSSTAGLRVHAQWVVLAPAPPLGGGVTQTLSFSIQ